MIIKCLRVLRYRSKEETGSVLTFGIGLTFLLLLLTTVVITYATAWSQKLTLQRISDAAALSAVQAVDVRSIYRDQLGKGVNLNSSIAKEKVERYLKRPEVYESMPNVELVSLVTSRSKVSITLSTTVNLPFGYSTNSIRIFATSSAIQILDQ